MSEALFGLACLVLLVAVWRSRRAERGHLALRPQPTVAMLPTCLRGPAGLAGVAKKRLTKKRRHLWSLPVSAKVEKLPEVGP